MAADSKWIVALSGNGLNAGLEEVAARRGARLLVVDWNEAPSLTGGRHLRLDIKDADAVLAALRPLLGRVLFAFSSSDAGTETAARINAELGHKRPAPESLAAARRKPAMNEAWGREDLLGKRFRVCADAAELARFQRGLRRDVIVKPCAGSSSIGVSALREDECDGAALAAAFAKASAADPGGEVLAEELVPGVEHTVEMLADAAGHVRVYGVSSKRHSANAGRGRVASKLHYNPPEMGSLRRLEIAEFGSRCLRALGLRASLAHLELIERPEGRLVPIEIGARSGGYIATHLLDAINEPERTLIGDYESVLRGGAVANETLEPRSSSMYFFYDFPPGVGRRSDLSLADFLPDGIESIAHDRSRLRAGERFAEIDSEFDRHGCEVLVGDAEVLTIEAVERAEAALRREFLEPEPEAAQALRPASPAPFPAAVPAT